MAMADDHSISTVRRLQEFPSAAILSWLLLNVTHPATDINPLILFVNSVYQHILWELPRTIMYHEPNIL